MSDGAEVRIGVIGVTLWRYYLSCGILLWGVLDEMGSACAGVENRLKVCVGTKYVREFPPPKTPSASPSPATYVPACTARR